jgi:hypothetical protein
MEKNAFYLVPEETSCNDDVHLHEDISVTIIMNSEEDKDLVSYGEFPFQIMDMKKF